MKTLRDIGEDALISRLIDLVPKDKDPSAGPGDDCALVDLDCNSPTLLLLKTDALVENIHFLPEADARAVGWKAAARVASDFAAMGGKGERYLITLALPPDCEVAWVEELYRGIGDCLEKFGGFLAGGETCGIPSGSAKVISIAATGSVERGKQVLRSTAKPGDAIFVTGTLGGSIHGKHLDFTPRAGASQWLTAHCKPTAMMDLSDGLAKDLPRMAKASGCGFELDMKNIPLTPGSSLAQALGDGEDFELLFTIAEEQAAGLLAGWPFSDLPLSRIGKMTDQENGNVLEGGWEHFIP